MPDRTLPTQMQAAALDAYGGPEVITLHTLPVPEMADDEIVLHVHTAGVGVWDALARQGKFLPEGASFPLVLGTDAAGTVVAAGKQVSNVAEGDTVYVYAFARPKGGCYAEYVVTKGVYAAPIPAGLPMQQAGAMPADALTALSGLDTLALEKGRTLLVFGASGGLGHLALQLARLQGLKVVAAASGDDGEALARRLGADLALNGHDDVEAQLEQIRNFAPDGLDGVLATAGGETLDTLLAAVKPGGRVVHPNGVQPVPTAPEGVEVKAYNGQTSPEQLQKLGQLIESGPFEVHVDQSFPLAQAAQAHEKMQGHYLGKLALSIAD